MVLYWNLFLYRVANLYVNKRERDRGGPSGDLLVSITTWRVKFPNKTLLCYQKRKLTEKRLVQITTYAFSGSIHTLSLLVKYFIISFNNIHWRLSNNYINSHTYTQLSILNNSKHLCFPTTYNIQHITYNI